MLADPEVDAVVVATPNDSHYQICLDAIAAGKHILAEKPLGLNAEQAIEMYKAAEAKGIKHMTAFTYRFAPSLRYLTHLAKSGELGELRHFRSQRFQDWPETSWGWRQYKKTAGAGHIYDMTSHRFDFAQDIMVSTVYPSVKCPHGRNLRADACLLQGEIDTVTGSLAQFCPRTKNPDGSECAPSEVRVLSYRTRCPGRRRSRQCFSMPVQAVECVAEVNLWVTRWMTGLLLSRGSRMALLVSGRAAR